jgi:cellulose synthase (UDP-forming)
VVDVFFTTYNEDVEIVQRGVRDAKAMRYPHAIDLRIHVLDDGRRPEMRAMTEDEGVGYITRDNNVGFKAGNLRNAMEQSAGDFIIICDADTRPMPTMLERCMGYFRDPDVAWVQTPQWFYDLPEGTPLPEAMARRLGASAAGSARGGGRARPDPRGPGPVPQRPGDVLPDHPAAAELGQRVLLLRRGSIHRREAVMQAALGAYADDVLRRAGEDAATVRKLTREKVWARRCSRPWSPEPWRSRSSRPTSSTSRGHLHVHRASRRSGAALEVGPAPLDRVQDALAPGPAELDGAALQVCGRQPRHPVPRQPAVPGQDVVLAARHVWRDRSGPTSAPLERGLPGGAAHLPVHRIAPVAAYTADFYIHILPFLILNDWPAWWGPGASRATGPSCGTSRSSRSTSARSGPWRRGEKIKFPVTPKTRQSGNFARLVAPQIAVVA